VLVRVLGLVCCELVHVPVLVFGIVLVLAPARVQHAHRYRR
jgi:hypothetical protein